MAQNEVDPAASTDRFRAFVDDEETGRGRTRRKRLPAVGIVSLLVLVAAAVLLGFVLLG